MTDRDDVIAGLQAMVEFLIAHPAVPLSGYSFNVFVEDRDEMARIARTATWEKVYAGPWFALRQTFQGGVELDVNVDRVKVCRQVVTGTRLVEAKPAVPEHEEAVMEWVCDEPVLTAAS